MGSNRAVSGVIGRKLISGAGFIWGTLWRGLAQCFDFYCYEKNKLKNVHREVIQF